MSNEKIGDLVYFKMYGEIDNQVMRQAGYDIFHKLYETVKMKVSGQMLQPIMSPVSTKAYELVH